MRCDRGDEKKKKTSAQVHVFAIRAKKLRFATAKTTCFMFLSLVTHFGPAEAQHLTVYIYTYIKNICVYVFLFTYIKYMFINISIFIYISFIFIYCFIFICVFIFFVLILIFHGFLFLCIFILLYVYIHVLTFLATKYVSFTTLIPTLTVVVDSYIQSPSVTDRPCNYGSPPKIHEFGQPLR